VEHVDVAAAEPERAERAGARAGGYGRGTAVRGYPGECGRLLGGGECGGCAVRNRSSHASGSVWRGDAFWVGRRVGWDWAAFSVGAGCESMEEARRVEWAFGGGF
jgi:hypothetical protein